MFNSSRQRGPHRTPSGGSGGVDGLVLPLSAQQRSASRRDSGSDTRFVVVVVVASVTLLALALGLLELRYGSVSSTLFAPSSAATRAGTPAIGTQQAPPSARPPATPSTTPSTRRAGAAAATAAAVGAVGPYEGAPQVVAELWAKVEASSPSIGDPFGVLASAEAARLPELKAIRAMGRHPVCIGQHWGQLRCAKQRASGSSSSSGSGSEEKAEDVYACVRTPEGSPLNKYASFGVAPESQPRAGVPVPLPSARRREWAVLNDAAWLKDAQEVLSPELPMRFQAFEQIGCYSQTTEDAVLMAVMAMIGTTSKTIVEVACGVGFESNSANLVLNFGWDAVMIDGSDTNIADATAFFRDHPAIKAGAARMPKLRDAMVYPTNINSLIQEMLPSHVATEAIGGGRKSSRPQGGGGGTADLDILSLDIDGMDYWVWEAITVVKPRVVMLEIQELFGWKEARTRPYAKSFARRGIASFGASLQAMIHVSRQKGYRLIGCVREGFNAVFLRSDVGLEVFGSNEYDPQGCFYHWNFGSPRMVETMNRRRFDAKVRDWLDPTTNVLYKAQQHELTPLVAPPEGVRLQY